MQETTIKEEGTKYDLGKPDFSLMPPSVLIDVVKVLTLGSEKYSRDNWMHLDDAENRYFAAAQRHMWARKNGELYDDESGLDHAAHAICCMIFLMAITKKDSIN